MSSLRICLWLIVLSSMFTQCKKRGCFTDSGLQTTREELVLPFQNIVLLDNIDLTLVQDTVHKISITAGNNLLSFIKASVQNNTLTIKNNSTCDWLRSPNEKIFITLHVQKLDTFYYEGSGDVWSKNELQQSKLVLDITHGAGTINLDVKANTTHVIIRDESADVILRGTTNECYVYCTSRGTIDLRDFICRHIEIYQRSVRDAYVHATESIDAKIQYKGNVYYKGNPGIKKVQMFDEGRLIPL